MIRKQEEWVSLILRLIIGGVFLAAALPKLADPLAFAHNVRAYELLNVPASRWVAVILPFVELALGVLLIAGIWVETATVMAAGLFAVFSVAIVSALMRGLTIECSCFGTGTPLTAGLLFRDLLWLMMCGGILWLHRGDPRHGRGRSPSCGS